MAELHRAHVVAVPFENLDPQRGVPVRLDAAALAQKLVHGRRGGYCFEQNLLLKAALEDLGYGVDMFLARVRWGRRSGDATARSHLVLRVTGGDGRSWHADVGFGAGTLLEPIPWGPGEVQDQAGWRFRVVDQDGELVLQSEREEGWLDVYAFAPQPVPRIDVEVSNWFTATHPSSGFVTGLIVAVQRGDGTRISLSDWHELELVEQTPARRRVTPVARHEIPRLLESRFGLSGFSLDARGRIVPD